jgi:F-type H+-transporting ATPase subunit b
MLLASFSSAVAALAAPVAAADEGGFDPFELAPGATLWTWLIFLVGMVAAWKFVFGPITTALDSRDQEVESARQAAEDTRREAEARIAEAKAELEQARIEGRRLVEEATSRAEKQGQEALAQARAEADRQLAQARAEIEASKQRALIEIRNEVVSLAIQGAGKILERDVDDEAHRKFVDEFVGSVGGGVKA